MAKSKIKTIHLINYLLHKVDNCDFLKILKLLYFIDFDHWATYGESVTDEKYYHLPNGPVPTTNYRATLLEKGQKLGFWEIFEKYKLKTKKEILELDKIGFSKEKIKTIKHIISKYGQLNGFELVSITHNDAPWFMSDVGEKIDYENVKWRLIEEPIIEIIN